MAAAKKNTAKAAKKPREVVVVGSKVKDVIRSAGYRSDGELVQIVAMRKLYLVSAQAPSCARFHQCIGFGVVHMTIFQDSIK